MKKKLTALSCVSLLVLLLSGCSNDRLMTDKIYTQEDMTHFYSDKIAIDDITNIDVESNYAEFDIIASDDYYVEYSYYYIDDQPKLTIKDHTLTFSDRGINKDSDVTDQKDPNYLKIYIPNTNQFKSISIDKSSGDCNIGSFSTEKLSLTNHYGDSVVGNCQADDMDADIASGKISIKSSKIQDLSLKNAYGEVELDSINDSFRWMDSLNIKMSSGNLTLNNLYCKDMELNNSYGMNSIKNCAIGKLDGSFNSGDVTVKETLADDIKIDNSYGNIVMDLLGRESDYQFDIQSDYGSVKVGDSTYDGNVRINMDGKKKIKVKVSSGDTEIKFKEQ